MTFHPNSETSAAAAAEPPVPPLVEVGDWIAETDLNRLRSGDSLIQVEPKIMRVLVMLAKNAGFLTSRADLLEEVWSSAHLGEDPTTRAVSELRRIFGDSPRDPSYIETIHGKGYRLIAKVNYPRELAEGPAYEPWRRLSSAAGLLLAAALILGVLFVWKDRHQGVLRGPQELRSIPFTTLPGREVHPVISPEGTRVAFARREAPGSRSDIYVKQRNAEKVLRLTETPATEFGPAWSPDGTEVAFVRFGEEGCGVYAAPAIGGPERSLTSCLGMVFSIDWSPDGRSLAISDRLEEGPMVLRIVDLETGASRRLVEPTEPYFHDSLPRFSNDGRRVAFRRRTGEASKEIFIVNLDGTGLSPLTDDGLDNGGFDWSSDGQSIIVSSNRRGSFGLWRIPIGRGEPEWLGIEDAFSPTTSPSGPVMAFEKRSYTLDLWRAPNPHRDQEGEATRWAGSTRFDLDPQYSPDGSRVAFISERSGSYELWVAEADGSQPRQLTFFASPTPVSSPAVQHPRWSPSGTEILFAARADGDFDIFSIRAEGGTPRPLTSSRGEDLSPIWTDDGQGIYFVSNRNGSYEIWRAAIDGQPKRVLDQEVLPGLDSAGDDRVFFVMKDCSLACFGADCDPDQALLSDFNSTSWGVGPEGVVFFKDEGLAHLPWGSSEAEVARIAGNHPSANSDMVADSSVALSPDGDWILYSARGSDESDLFLVERIP